MRTSLASLPLALALAACTPSDSTTSPTTNPTTAPATQPPAATPQPEPANPDEDAGGFADPRIVDPPAPTPAPSEPVDPALATRVKEKFGERCKLERSCGDLLGVDCGAAVDGPYYYAQRSDLKTVSTCGGACMGGRCTDCPPKAWTCATY